MKSNPHLTGKLPRPPISLKQKVLSNINNDDFFGEYLGVDFTYARNQVCPFVGHEDTNASFRAKEDGSYICYGCDKSGSNVIQFYAHIKNISFASALEHLSYQYISVANQKSLSMKVIGYKKALKKDPSTVRFLEVSRGWSKDVIEYFSLGLQIVDDVKYITIPIKDEYNYIKTIQYYNVFGDESKPKFFYDKEGDNTSSIFGLECIASSKTVYFFEGIPDTLLALSLGFPAVTLGSAKAWRDSWKEYFRGLDAVVCYDNDSAGIAGGNFLSNQLIIVGKSVKRITFPEKQDFTSYLIGHNFNKKIFADLVTDTEYHKIAAAISVSEDIEGDTALPTTLSKASEAENFGKKLKLVALVSGKEPAPLLIPKKMLVSCKDSPNKNKCATCALDDSPTLAKLFSVDSYFKDLLKWVATSAKDHSRVYRHSLGVNTRCRVDIENISMWNLEKVVLNSPVRHGKTDENPERRIAYYLGSGLAVNKHYVFDLYTVQHPVDNSAVHIITHAEPLDTELETFTPTEDIVNTLKSFSVQSITIQKKLDDIYGVLSRNVTRIWGRDLLHIAIDLPFFSPNSFIFDNETISKAGLDILVFGDQRCGKGKIAEGLSNYYKFAEVLSGENTSFMNLVGGIESNDNFRGLKWGRIVANNGGVVIIDEASSLEIKTIARLSRIRSEGLAELDKFGIHAKAFARCSLVWIANPRNNPISKYNFGIECLPELIGQPEDIARFDYAIGVRTNEVEAGLINRTVEPVEDLYGSNLHRTLILWCKTRTAENIIFEPEAIDGIYEASKRLGEKYTASIPLVQIENIRIKLAKIAAAIAGRTFSADFKGKNMLVQMRHVQFAEHFLHRIYDSPAIAYDGYSKMDKLNATVNIAQLDSLLEPLKEMQSEQSFISGMLRLQQITPNDIADISAQNFYDAKTLVSSLARLGALKKEKNYYIKTQAFIEYLKSRFGVVSAA